MTNIAPDDQGPQVQPGMTPGVAGPPSDTGKVANETPTTAGTGEIGSSVGTAEKTPAEIQTQDASQPSLQGPNQNLLAPKGATEKRGDASGPGEEGSLDGLPFFSKISHMTNQTLGDALSGLDEHTKALLLGAMANTNETAAEASGLFGADGDDAETQIDEVLRVFTEAPAGTQRDFIAGQNFMKLIAEAMSLISLIQGQMDQQGGQDIIDAQYRNLEDNAEGMKVVEERLEKIQALRAKIDKMKGGPLGKIGGLGIAGMVLGSVLLVALVIAIIVLIIVVAIVVAVVATVVTAIVVALILAVVLMLPVLIGFGVAVAQASGADVFKEINKMFGGSEENAWIAQIVIGVILTVATFGAFAPIFFMQWVPETTEKKEMYAERAGRKKDKEEIGRLSEVEEEKARLNKQMYKAKAMLLDAGTMDEDQVDFMAGMAAIMAMLTQMMTAMKGLGMDGPPAAPGETQDMLPEGEVPPYVMGQMAAGATEPPSVSPAQLQSMISKLQQAVAKLKIFVAAFKEDPDKAKDEFGDILPQFMNVTRKTGEALLLAHGMEFENQLLNRAIYEAVFDAMATVDPKYEKYEERKAYWEELSAQSDQIRSQGGGIYDLMKSIGLGSTEGNPAAISGA